MICVVNFGKGRDYMGSLILLLFYVWEFSLRYRDECGVVESIVIERYLI